MEMRTEHSTITMLFTKLFSVLSRRSMGYIQPYCTGPLSSASSRRWTDKCTITVKNVGGKIFSSLHRITEISCFRRWITSFLKFLLHNSLKNFPSSGTASYTSLSTSPLKPTGRILCRRIWHEWAFNRPANFVSSSLKYFARLAAYPSGNLTPVRN